MPTKCRQRLKRFNLKKNGVRLRYLKITATRNIIFKKIGQLSLAPEQCKKPPYS